MKTTPEKPIEELEEEQAELLKKLATKIKMPGLQKLPDITLKRLMRYDAGFAAQVERIVPELARHPYFREIETELDTFSVAHPQAGPGKNLAISHATGVDAGVSYHYDSGIAVFHSSMMGDLFIPPSNPDTDEQGTQFYPEVALRYTFPDTDDAGAYKVEFELFLFDTTGNNQRSSFDLSVSGSTIPARRRVHQLTLPDDTYTTLSVRVSAAQVRGRQIRFSLKHLDFAGSHLNWWFKRAKVSAIRYER